MKGRGTPKTRFLPGVCLDGRGCRWSDSGRTVHICLEGERGGKENLLCSTLWIKKRKKKTALTIPEDINKSWLVWRITELSEGTSKDFFPLLFTEVTVLFSLAMGIRKQGSTHDDI